MLMLKFNKNMDLISLVLNILYNKHIKPAYIEYTPNIDVEYSSQKYYYVELNIITQILWEELQKYKNTEVW